MDTGKMMQLLAGLLCVLLPFLCSCSKPKLNINADQKVESEYHVGVHDTFQISMRSNPTTGYRWVWENKETVTALAMVERKYIPDTSGNKAMVGRGGKETWKFTAIRSGAYTLRFIYSRPWEMDTVAKRETFIFQIR